MYYHEETTAEGEDTSVICPLQLSEAEGLCTLCGFERDTNRDRIEDFIEAEILQAELIASNDQWLRARFANDGLSEIRETFENGAFNYDREGGIEDNINPLKAWTGMRMHWACALADEADSYVTVGRTPTPDLLEYLMACVLLCNRMISHHQPIEASNS